MKKVLIVSDILSGFGGTEAAIIRTARLLRQEQGVDVDIFVHGGDDGVADFGWLQGSSHSVWKTRIRNHKLRQLLAAQALARRIRMLKPDVVLAVTPVSCYVARWGLRFSRSSIPLVSWMHTCVGYKKKNIKLADSHLAISTDIQQQFHELGESAEAIHLVFNPVTPSAMTIARPQQGAEIVYVGRVNFGYQKNLKELFDGCAQLRGEWRLHIVGDGQDAALCRQYAEELGIASRIVWHGWQKDPWAYVHDSIREVSCMALCSQEEPFGLVLVEALARGVYCIAAQCVGGPRDIIQPGVNGSLYPPNDVPTLSASLQEVVDGKALPSAASLKHSVECFHDEAFARNFYEKLLLSAERYRSAGA